MDALNELLASLPGYSLLTDAMKQRALDGSLVPDGLGVWPGQPGYQPTYDVYFAALALLPFLAAQPHVKSAGSEGTTVSVEGPSWSTLSSYYASQSHIVGLAGSSLLREVLIPGGAHVKKTDMSGRDGMGRVDGYHGDVDNRPL